MSLSAERIALANCTIERTFGQASVAWQAIPHWDTGDPGQTMVRDDAVVTLAAAGVQNAPPVPPLPAGPFGTGTLEFRAHTVPFLVTLAQAGSATPDALLAAVIPRAVQLAQVFDDTVLPALAAPASAAAVPPLALSPWYPQLAAPASFAAPATNAGRTIRTALGAGRRLLEDSGFRAPSCLIASTEHFTDLSQWVGSNVATEGLLVGANANSLFRASALDTTGPNALPDRMLMLGRRQEIAHGRAATATPGEEPVDLAVSVPPSLEVVGENAAGQIQLAVRIRYALRFKDERGVVVFHP